MAGGDQPQWPPGFTPGPTDGAQPSVVRRPPVAGAPATDVPPQSNGLWPPGFIPGDPGGGTTSPQPAPDATSQPAPGSPGAPPKAPPTWGEAFGSMVSLPKLKESGVKLVQDIAEGVSKKAHEVAADPLGAAESVVRKGLEPFTTPGGPLVYGATRVAKPFLSEDMKTKVNDALGGKAPEGDPMVQMLVDRYGSLDKLKQTMHDDPAGTWLDISTLFAGGEALAARSGLTTTAKALGVGARLDPITLAMRGLPGLPQFGLEAATGKILPDVLGRRSGLGPDVTKDIRDLHDVKTDAAKFYGNEGRERFQEAFTGKVPPRDLANKIIDEAEQGVKNMKGNANLGYKLDKDDWVKAGGKLDMSIIDNAEAQMRQSLHTPGGIDLLNAQQREAVTKMTDVIDEVRRKGPGGWTVEELDALKRRINKVAVPLGDRELMRVRTGLANSVKDNILHNAQGTKYHESMGRYQSAMNDLDELRSSLSLDKDASAHTIMTKLQSVLRNNTATQYGVRQGLLDMLEKEGNVKLKPWLLGMATNVDNPRGITGAMSAAQSIPAIAGGSAGYAYMGPWGLLGAPVAAGIDMASRSPRVAGKVSRHIGTHGGAWSEAFPLLRYPAVAAGHQDREEDLKKQGRARGGRVGYADGGEVLEDDALAANPAVGRVRRSYFTPISVTNPAKITASKGIFGKLPEAPLAKLPTAGEKPAGGTTGGDVFGGIANLWNAPFEQKRRQEETARKEEAARLSKEAADLEKQKAAIGTGAQAKADGTTPAPGTTPGGGVLQGTPIPGDTYEAKVGSFESSGSDTAVNKTSGAAGRYQFMPSTAEGLRKQFPDLKISDQWRTNPEDQQKLMTAYTNISRDSLRKALGREPTGGELYALHLFGHGKGPSIVAGGNAPLISLTTEQERSGNPFLNNFKTAADLINYFNKRFG